MKGAERLLWYISKRKDGGLHFRLFAEGTYPIPYVCSDADWASNKETRKGTGAYLWTISCPGTNSSNTAVSWSSKQQSTVALSSTEAEYMALTQACKEAIWVQRLLR